MARATFVKNARKNIYQNGKLVEYVSQRGKRIGQTKQKLDRTVPRDENDPVFIAAGEPYYWWSFKNGPKRYSKTKPRQSQLTQSEYLSTLYEIEEDIQDLTIDPSQSQEDQISWLQMSCEEFQQRLEELRDETQEKLDNMPDQLQDGDVGQMLQERIEQLDSAISELENIDFEYDVDDEDEDEETRNAEFAEWIERTIEEIKCISLQ